MTRKLNVESKAEIMRWENGPDGKPKLKAYKDSGGVWTIGTGHTGKVNGRVINSKTQITAEEADALFDDDMNWACAAVERYVRVDLTDNQFGALVSWTENVGEANMKNSTLVRKLNQGNYNAVPTELMKWVKDQDRKTGKLVTVPGLVNRRSADAGLWAKGAYVASVIGTPNIEKAAPPAPATRDVVAHVAPAGLGIATLSAIPVKDVVDAVSSQQSEITSGDYIRIVVALLIVAGTAYALYRKFKNHD